MTTPNPTVGRKVWYYGQSLIGANDRNVPFDATIIFVWTPTMVNLRVTDHAGGVHIKTSIQLRAPDAGDAHGSSNFATWTPHQMREHAKDFPSTTPAADAAS